MGAFLGDIRAQNIIVARKVLVLYVKSQHMKIRKLSIKNYKIFDDVEFDFTDADGKTLDTVVFAGVNGCGKTTVLEVIATCLYKRFNPIPDKAEISIEVDPRF